jgi:hypothetical protein
MNQDHATAQTYDECREIYQLLADGIGPLCLARRGEDRFLACRGLERAVLASTTILIDHYKVLINEDGEIESISEFWPVIPPTLFSEENMPEGFESLGHYLCRHKESGLIIIHHPFCDD